MITTKRRLIITAALLCLACCALAADSQTETELYKAGINLIPSPQQAQLEGGNFTFTDQIVIVLDKDASEADKFAATELINDLREKNINAVIAGRSLEKSIILTRKGAPEKIGEQGYQLSVAPDKITISANSEAGLFYGARTLLQIIQNDSSGPYIKGLKITDWPDLLERAVHYDTKHHQDKAEYVRKFIRDLADYKINMLVWEWEDKFAYPSHPEIGAPGAFTMEQMENFTKYAQRYHVQLVPLVQGLGHVSFILKWPRHAHLREIPASNWEFCPLREDSYQLLFDLWEDAIKATPGSKYIHIGSDETYELGQGVECGCKAKAEEIGRSGLYHIFVGRAVRHLAPMGRQVMAWERALGWEKGRSPAKGITPAKGLVLTESGSYGENYSWAFESKKQGFPIFFYDPNPGIEHLFLPYFERIRRGRAAPGCLENSHDQLSAAAQSGAFDGMINTSWDDSGLHNQVWMMTFVNSAEFSWTGAQPALDEFIDKYYQNYYGEKAADVKELYLLLNRAAYYYMDTFERNVWHHGEIGKTHVPDLPRGDAIEYDPYWNTRYKDMIDRSKEQLPKMDRVLEICNENITQGVKNKYDFEIYATIAELVKHTCETYIDLSELENCVKRAHRQRFVSHQAAYQAMQDAVDLIQNNLTERQQVFDNLVVVWEKTRLAKGMSTPDKEYFYRQDRARHYANRRPDMTYLIYDEQLLDLEGYLTKLRDYMEWYKKTYL